MAKLVLSCGGNVLSSRFIDTSPICIGRGANGELIIDAAVNREKHAEIVIIGNDHVLADLSGDGVTVNGKRCERHILQHRDVISIGDLNICFMNSKASAPVDFDRTMLIAALPKSASIKGTTAAELVVNSSSGRSRRAHWPTAWVNRMTEGRFPQKIDLDRVVTIFGETGGTQAVVTRRPHGFSITRVDGRECPRVNRQEIGAEARTLKDHDLIEVGKQRLEFRVDPSAAKL